MLRGAKGLRSKVDDLLPNLNTRVLAETEARALGGENKGLIYVAEGPKGKPAAQEFQAGTNGAFTDLATGKGGGGRCVIPTPMKKASILLSLTELRRQLMVRLLC